MEGDITGERGWKDTTGSLKPGARRDLPPAWEVLKALLWFPADG